MEIPGGLQMEPPEQPRRGLVGGTGAGARPPGDSRIPERPYRRDPVELPAEQGAADTAAPPLREPHQADARVNHPVVVA
jgi:hypothetical protein